MHLPRSCRTLWSILGASALSVLTLNSQDAQPAAPATPPAADADSDASQRPAAPAAPDPSAPGGPPGGIRPGGPPGGFPGGPGSFPGFRRREGFGPGAGAGMAGAPSALSETIRIEGDNVALQFPNNPVADMLSIYELLTGITLVKDTSIFEGPQVSLATPRAVPKEEAIKLIEAALLTNGYAIVMEPDGKSARILPARTQSANSVQFSHGLQFYTSPADLPQGETIITYFMTLDFLDPEQAAQMFSGHIGLGVYGRITPVLTPPGLLITESSTVVKQLVKIREAIDVSGSGAALVTKFIPVIYADSATIAQIIQATLNAQAQEKESKGVNTIRGTAVADNRREERQDSSSQQRPPQPIFINGQMVQQGSSQAPQPSAQVIADTRLNQILVIAAPADYTYVASLIAEFDKPLVVEEPYERKLQYASAIDVLSALVDLLQDTSAGAVQLPGGGTIQQQRQQPLASSSSQLLSGRNTQNTRGGQILASTGSASTSSDTATSTTSSGLGSRADVIQGPSQDNAPISVLVNKTRIVADPMSNSILVIGRREDAAKVDSLLDKLDRKPAQVYLATVIGQLTLGKDFQFGLDYLSEINNRFSGGQIVGRDDILTGNGFINPANTDAGLRAIRDLRNNLITTPFGPAQGLNLYGAIGQNLEVFVTALESTNNFKVLSRPAVFTLNNKKASITSGTIIPVPGQTTVTNNNVITGVDYRDVVLKLEVVPLINPNGEVSLTISQVNDTVVGSQVIENNAIPVIGTQQLITTVTVPSGKTIVLGGLISEQQKKDVDGIPFLSRIPGLGHLFKETVDSDTRSELIIFIQPCVVTDDMSLYNASAGEDARTKIGIDAAAKFPGACVDGKVAPALLDPMPPPEKKGFFSRMFKPRDKTAPAPVAPSMKRM